MNKKLFSSREYKDNEWQIVVVGVDSDDKDAISDYLKKVINASETTKLSKTMKPGKKKWEERC